MTSAWSGRRLLRWSALWLPAVVLGVLAWRHRWVADDGFIDLHIADNLLSGLGPVFNAGERVEAYTSPLWVALLALVAWPTKPFVAEGLPPFEWISVGLGLLISVAALGIASMASDRLRRSDEAASLPIPFGALGILAVEPFWDYSTSGLETSLVFLWLALSFWATVVTRDRPTRLAQLLTGLLVGLGPLVRPDLGIFSVLFGGLTIAFAAGRRRRLEILAAMLALPLAYQLFRMGYFACLLPNTALAKEASFAYWRHGWVYFVEFEKTYELWVLLIALIAAEVFLFGSFWKGKDRRSALLVAAPALGGLLHGLYITRVGGDFLHARLLLPAVFALAMPVATLRLREFKILGLVLVPWAIVCVLTSEIPLDKDDLGIERGRLNFILLSKSDHPVSLDDYRQMGWSIEVDKLFKQIDDANQTKPDRTERGLFSKWASSASLPAAFNPWIHAEAVAYRGAIGLLGYRGRQRLFVCDFHGLADPIASRLELASVDKGGVWHSGRGKPGHEKRLKSDWCVARLVASLDAKPTAANVRVLLAALGCGDLAELQAATTTRLTWKRFWRNVWVAPRLTRVRIPQDFVEARERFCGS